MERLSRFTHITPYSGEYIYYNSARGTSSMVMLDKDIRKCSCTSLDDVAISRLRENGHLVGNDTDEEQILQALQESFDHRNYLNLIILPNEECNFRCVYCYETLKHRVMDDTTVDSVIRYVANNLSRFNSLHVDWFGGEPLLSMKTIMKMSKTFIEICHKNKKGFTASMTTNGYCLDLETFRALRKCNVTLYQITIDGYRDVHDAQRPLHNGNGTFDRIMENLKSIKENIRSHTFEIILRTNCSLKHLDTFDIYLEELSRVFGDDKRFTVLLRPVMDWGGERVKQFRNEMIGIESLQVFAEAFMKKQRSVLLPQHTSSLEPLDSVCYAGNKNSIAIDSRGDLFRCTCDFDNNRNSKIGTLCNGECKFDDIECLERWNSNTKYRRTVCNTCDILPLCLGDHCPGYRLAGHDSHGGCPFEKYLLDEYIIMAWEAIHHKNRRVHKYGA